MKPKSKSKSKLKPKPEPEPESESEPEPESAAMDSPLSAAGGGFHKLASALALLSPQDIKEIGVLEISVPDPKEKEKVKAAKKKGFILGPGLHLFLADAQYHETLDQRWIVYQFADDKKEHGGNGVTTRRTSERVPDEERKYGTPLARRLVKPVTHFYNLDSAAAGAAGGAGAPQGAHGRRRRASPVAARGCALGPRGDGDGAAGGGGTAAGGSARGAVEGEGAHALVRWADETDPWAVATLAGVEYLCTIVVVRGCAQTKMLKQQLSHATVRMQAEVPLCVRVVDHGHPRRGREPISGCTDDRPDRRTAVHTKYAPRPPPSMRVGVDLGQLRQRRRAR